MTVASVRGDGGRRAEFLQRDAWFRPLLCILTLPPVAYAAWTGRCVLGLGGYAVGEAGLLIALYALLSMAAFPVGFVLVLFFKTHVDGMRVVILGCWSMLACVLAVAGGDLLRMQAFASAAECAVPLVRAIERHERERGSPPESLAALVPGFLDAIPTRFHSLTIETDSEATLGRRWMLVLSCASGRFNRDSFRYLSDQQYPERAWGGRLQRIGAWVYVHD